MRLRELVDRLTRHVEDLDSDRDRAAVVQDKLANRLSEQLNLRMYVRGGVPVALVHYRAPRHQRGRHDGLYGVDLKETEQGVCVIEVSDDPSLDAGIAARWGSVITMGARILQQRTARGGGRVLPQMGILPPIQRG